MLLQPHHISLTLIAGESQTLQRELAWGVPLARLSVGSLADWQIRGPGILDVHFHLSFDGHRLRGAAACPTAKVGVHGTDLGCEWVDLELPFELGFGSARLAGHVVGNSGARRDSASALKLRPGEPLDLAKTDGLQTQFVDLSAFGGAALERHATLSIEAAVAEEPSERPEPAPTTSAHPARTMSSNAPPFQVVSGSTWAWSLGTLQPQSHSPSRPQPGPRPPEPERPSPSRALTHTVSDGGALHDYAQQLASQAHARGHDATGRANPRSPAAIDPHVAMPAANPAVAVVAPKASALPTPLTRGWARVKSALRGVPPRQRWLALPVLVSLGLLPWLLATPSTALKLENAVEPRASEPRPRATPSDGEARTAVPRAEPVNALTRPDAGGSTSSPEPAPRDRRVVRPSSLESEALRAAFGGNLTEAAVLYEKLAEQRGERVFEHAARLLRANRVHRP